MYNRLHPGTPLLLLLAACLALTACSAPLRPGTAGTTPPAQAARHNAENGHYARAAQLYAYAARQQQQADKRDALRLEGALAALRAERTRQARQLLQAIDTAHLGTTAQKRYELAQTLVRIAGMAPDQALQQLPPPSGHTPPKLAAYIWKTRAQLLFAQYKYVAGIHNLVQRSVWLVNEQAQRRNNQLIFSRALEAVELGRGTNSPAAQHADATTLGWLRLAQIKRNGPHQGPALQQALKRWENRFTGHPATGGLLQTRFDYQPYSKPQPITPEKRVGQGPMILFLPLSGDIAQPARAIRAGFEHAHAASGSGRRVIVVDSTGLDAHDMLQRARSTSAAMIIGPLKKHKVAALARQAPRLPVLALNQVDGVSMPPGFYRYALAPEDEARTAARHAAAKGWHRALALVPQGDWGQRVLQAFRDAFAQRGGTLVDYARFDPGRYDHQYAVQSVLQSYHRGTPIDFVFIAARPTHARLLSSQLRFFHAATLPVIATSDIYSGIPAPRKDEDLDGVGFAVVPWLFREQTLPPHASSAGQRFPQLFAMGMDAWRLASRLAHGDLQAGDTIPGATGVLEVQPNGRIRRHLAWARFVNGHARLVAPASADGSTMPLPGREPVRNLHTQPRDTPDAATSHHSYGPVYRHTQDGVTTAPARHTTQTGDSQYGPVYDGQDAGATAR